MTKFTYQVLTATTWQGALLNVQVINHICIGSNEHIASMNNLSMVLPVISLEVVNVSLALIINEFFACISIWIGLQCLSLFRQDEVGMFNKANRVIRWLPAQMMCSPKFLNQISIIFCYLQVAWYLNSYFWFCQDGLDGSELTSR